MAAPILREPPITFREAVIPYAVAGFNILAAIFFARHIVTPRAFLLAIALILIGLPVSVIFRQREYHRILLNVIVMAPLLLLTWLMVRGLPGMQIDWEHPFESLMMIESTDCLVSLLHIVTITAAGRAFLLVTPRDLLQTPIPSVSIFLLATITQIQTKTAGKDLISLLCLLLLLATSLYLFGLAHSQLWFSVHTPFRVQHQLLIWMLTCSFALFPLIIAAGYAMQPFNMTRVAQANAQHRYPHFRFPGFLKNASGISMDDSIRVGGPQWPSGNQLIMYVSTDHVASLLWRSTYYTLYQQGTWQNDMHTLPLRAASATAPIILNPRIPPSDPGIIEAIAEKKISLDEASTDLHHQQFDVRTQNIGVPVPIFGAAQIYKFQSKHRRLSRFVGDADSGLRMTALNYDDNMVPPYSVLSICKPSPLTFRLAKPVILPDKEHYLEIPDRQVRLMVTRKALDILDKANLTPASDPYLIVQQFETYLAANYQYTLRPSAPKRNVDPVIDFLYYQKRGYCVQFASAMTLLCRSMGIPARFTVGFATGEQLDDKKNTRGAVTYKVTADDAHSWVEVFLPRYGWYTSDPTAGSTEVPSIWGKTVSIFTEMVGVLRQTVKRWMHAFRADKRLQLTIYAVGIIALVISAGVLLLRREHPPTLPTHTLTSIEARQTILHAYRRMHRWLSRWGIAKPRGLTAVEFDEFFITINETMATTVKEITALYIQTQYSAAEMTDDDARKAIMLLQRLWEQSKTERKQLQRVVTGALNEE